MTGSSFLDIFLGWFVIAIPFLVTVGAAVLSLKLPPEAHYRRYAVGSIVLGLLFSILTFWQQNRTSRQAIKDRSEATNDTANRVAKQTTDNVTQALEKQYGTTIKEMASQLTVVGQSNIVTGKKPVQVVVTNSAFNGSSELPEIHVSDIPGTPDLTYGKKAVEFIVTTNKVMNGGRLRVTCPKTKINKGSVLIAGAGMMMGGGGTVDDHTFLSNIEAPNWSPNFPLLITLYFDSDDLGTYSFTPLK